jgi:hypothetical protein
VYAWRGEKDKAIEWLERALVQNDGGLAFVRVDPLLGAPAHDARFQALLEKMDSRGDLGRPVVCVRFSGSMPRVTLPYRQQRHQAASYPRVEAISRRQPRAEPDHHEAEMNTKPLFHCALALLALTSSRASVAQEELRHQFEQQFGDGLCAHRERQHRAHTSAGRSRHRPGRSSGIFIDTTQRGVGGRQSRPPYP